MSVNLSSLHLQDADIDTERFFDAWYSSGEASHVWLEVEAPLINEAVLRSNGNVQHLMMDAVTAFDSKPLSCGSHRQFLVLPGTSESISGLMSKGDRVRLAESVLLVTITGEQGAHNGYPRRPGCGWQSFSSEAGECVSTRLT
jgi:hypothetical protein